MSKLIDDEGDDDSTTISEEMTLVAIDEIVELCFIIFGNRVGPAEKTKSFVSTNSNDDRPSFYSMRHDDVHQLTTRSEYDHLNSVKNNATTLEKSLSIRCSSFGNRPANILDRNADNP